MTDSLCCDCVGGAYTGLLSLQAQPPSHPRNHQVCQKWPNNDPVWDTYQSYESVVGTKCHLWLIYLLCCHVMYDRKSWLTNVMFEGFRSGEFCQPVSDIRDVSVKPTNVSVLTGWLFISKFTYSWVSLAYIWIQTPCIFGFIHIMNKSDPRTYQCSTPKRTCNRMQAMTLNCDCLLSNTPWGTDTFERRQ